MFELQVDALLNSNNEISVTVELKTNNRSVSTTEYDLG